MLSYGTNTFIFKIHYGGVILINIWPYCKASFKKSWVHKTFVNIYSTDTKSTSVIM